MQFLSKIQTWLIDCYYTLLCFIHRSSREETQIIFPNDIDDENFDNFVLKKHCKNSPCTTTPKESKGKEMNR